MKIHTLTFGSEINFSLQVGDVVYYSPVSSVASEGSFNTVDNYDNIVKFGVVSALLPPNSIDVVYDNVGQAGGGPQSGGGSMGVDPVNPPQPGDYIMFAKNKEVNSSSLKGYYAEVEFNNYSTDRIELFSVGSEVSESSK
tara:strand:- start:749 stop:1168 length:420 start_codon:yes stop_codon:yes gene_type:complete